MTLTPISEAADFRRADLSMNVLQHFAIFYNQDFVNVINELKAMIIKSKCVLLSGKHQLFVIHHSINDVI